MKITLTRVEELHTKTKNGKGVYQGCLSVQERQLQAEIYASAKLRPVKVTAKNAAAKFNQLRKEF
jgi:hypothetical protein